LKIKTFYYNKRIIMNKTLLKNNSFLPLVVIFGRTNVGKSTLFNCLTERRQALVSDVPGTTRDSNLGEARWRGREFALVDSGGIIDLKPLGDQTRPEEEINLQVQRQALNYLKQSTLILFLVDNKAGLLPQDKELALWLKRNTDIKKVMLVANKVDAPGDRFKVPEFYQLSLGEPLPISAANGSGTGDLLDIIVEKLKSKEPAALSKEPVSGPQSPVSSLRVCIIGQPNVGKSSLLNSLLGYRRVIVSPVPHTTREPQHTKIVYQNQPLLLIDTAGISKKGDKAPGLEKDGIAKSLAALAKSDLALLVLDISQPLTRQDARLVEKIVNGQKSFIFIANKWDLIKPHDTKKYTNYIYNQLPFARFAPSQFISAKTGEKVKKILDLILSINEQRKLELRDEELEKFLRRLVRLHRPAKGKGLRCPRIKGLRQIQTNPPRFEIKIGAKEDLHFSYVRFIENRLRESYGFLGTPIHIQVAKAMHKQRQK
jgi:GTP-binding protein